MKIPLSAPDIVEADIEAVVEVLRTPRINTRSEARGIRGCVRAL